MDLRFDGKVALVTGAGSGIGASIAQDLAASGAQVVVQDLDLQKAQAVTNAILARGKTATAANGDVSDADQVAALVRNTVGWGGGLHLLVDGGYTAQ